MTCTEFLAQLDEMLDPVLAGPLRADLEEHLRSCEHCEITLNTTRKTIEIYRSHELYAMPEDLRDRLHKAILAKCKKC
ncbi:MAG TPA: zf-HC2 domain-containing protein [Acidobacteriaceae bacterium]|nr:zf-HC2 domain-containing protein [Acidobacteriaceae bacterium]